MCRWKWNRVGIAFASIWALAILAVAYFGVLCRKYGSIPISQQEFYGEKNQNLKDFEQAGEKLVSVSGDPWVSCAFSDTVDIKVIELDIRDMERQGMRGEVFNTDTWESREFKVHNGRIFIFYGKDKGHGIKNLRFDLVEEAGACLNVGAVVVNSRAGIALGTVACFGPLFVCVLLVEWMLFLFSEMVKGNGERMLPKMALTSIWVGLQGLTAGAAFYIVACTDRTELEIKWIWLLCLAQLCLAFLTLHGKMAGRRTACAQAFFVSERVCFILACIGMLEVSSGILYDFQDLVGGMWNFLLLWVAVVALSFILRSGRAAAMAISAAVAILGTANHYYYLFRGGPLQLSDILLAGTALTVVGNYAYPVSGMMAFFFLAVADLFFYCLLLDGRRRMGRRGRQACVAGVFGVLLGISAYTPGLSYWNTVQSTHQYGYLNAFVAYARADLEHKKPPGYSVQEVEGILGQYPKELPAGDMANLYPEELPAGDMADIIVIMDEAFADLPAVYGFETDVDGMPFIHALEKNTVKGDMLVSVFGGSTANTEYEFLTGNTMAFLHAGNVPYVQFIKSRQESLADRLRGLGYGTAAFHPAAAGNYSRDKVYPLLGFDEFVTVDGDLKHREGLRGYMSDESDFLNVIDLYENRQAGRPFFLFNVTMQNHGGYSYGESTIEIEVTVNPVREELRHAQLLEYLSLVKKTDEAFEMLVEYFSGVAKKTVVLLFGDHQPGLDSEIYEMLQGDDAGEGLEQKMYRVPFLLWANFDIPGRSGELTSPGYLRQMLSEVAGVPLDRYGQFLEACREQYPAIHSLGYFDQAGGWNPMGEMPEEGMLRQYWALQYANSFDKRAKGLFK